MEDIDDESTDLIHDLVAKELEMQRISVEEMGQIISALFAGSWADMELTPEHTGPDFWSWNDATTNLPKRYVLSPCQSPGLEGYPLITIVQQVSKRMDSWISFSCLMVGNTPELVEFRLAEVLVHHAGAHGGLRGTIVETLRKGNLEAYRFAQRISEGADASSTDDAEQAVLDLAAAIKRQNNDAGGMN